MRRQLPNLPKLPDLIIDAHAHVGAVHSFFIPDNGPASMVRVMDLCGVTQTVLSSHKSLFCDTTDGNNVTATVIGQFPDRLRGYLSINPWQDPARELARWHGHRGFVGIKLHPVVHDYPLDGPRYQPVWDFAARTKCPVLTHTWPEPEDNPEMVRRVATRNPEVTLLAGHAGAIPQGIEQSIAVAKDCPNVILEICSSYISGYEISHMVDMLGPRQVVFGTDFPFIDPRFSLGRTMYARMTDGERAAVLGGTMADLLKTAGEPFLK